MTNGFHLRMDETWGSGQAARSGEAESASPSRARGQNPTDRTYGSATIAQRSKSDGTALLIPHQVVHGHGDSLSIAIVVGGGVTGPTPLPPVRSSEPRHSAWKRTPRGWPQPRSFGCRPAWPCCARDRD